MVMKIPVKTLVIGDEEELKELLSVMLIALFTFIAFLLQTGRKILV